MRVIIDAERCQGHQMCSIAAPEVFGADDYGTSVLLISHQLNLVARFASRIVLLANGKVVADGPPSDVMQGDRLEAVYGWPVVVTRDPAVGAPVLVPLRRRAPR